MPEKVLGMRAALFFRVIKNIRKIHSRERSLFMADLCDVGVIPLNFQNYKSSKENFVNRAFDRKKKVLPADNIQTAQIAAAMFRSSSPMSARQH